MHSVLGRPERKLSYGTWSVAPVTAAVSPASLREVSESLGWDMPPTWKRKNP